MDGQRALLSQQQVLNLQVKPEELGVPQHRRSANYKPTIWEYHLLQSLYSNYDGDDYAERVAKMKEKLKVMFLEAIGDEVAVLELIDCLRKLGISSIFEEQIHKALPTVATRNDKSNPNAQQDLYVVALRFKLLRLHGYDVSQDVFNVFLNENGEFSESKCGDKKGLIELYEASFLASEGEYILDEAKAFSMRSLKRYVGPRGDDRPWGERVAHALELSSHWRVPWFDVKWQIDMHEKNKSMSTDLVDFAKFHFNVVQAPLQNDIRQLSTWWKDINMMEHLGFARDRVVESFMCSVGLTTEPQFSFFRKCLTKVIIFVLVIDDIYDLYGSLDELRHFTNAVNRWDLKESQQLPEGMKRCLQVLFDVTHETAYEIQKQMGWSPQILQHLKKVWADFCGALYKEAKWFNEGHTPTLEEYLQTARVSSSGPAICVHAFLSLMLEPPENLQNFLENHHDISYNISTVVRLCNDLGTSRAEIERGDNPSSIVCYMKEAKVSQEEAEKHIKQLINMSWRKINEKCFKSQLPFHRCFVEVMMNIGRVAHNLYQYGDGFGVQDKETKQQIVSLLVHPYKL